VNARELAVAALVRVEDGAYSNLAVPAALRRSGLSARDRAFVTDLVYGTLREQRRLDAVLEPFADRAVARLDAPVRAALRVGAYQLVHGVPAHAAVRETVESAPRRARGFVNAVLRAVAASGPPWPEPADLATRCSYPDWIVDELRGVAADEPDLEVLLATGNRPPALTLRPNPIVTTGDAVEQELRASGADVARGDLVADAVLVRGAGDPSALPAVAEGRATPQDQASQAVVGYLAPGVGDRVLDVAAAPGGKSTAIAERVGASGRVVASDIDAGRLRLVVDAARRLHLTAEIDAVVADGRRPPFPPFSRSALPGASGFDAVLVDAPCSGLGVLRRRAESRWRIRPESVGELAALQRDLLRAAATVVRPGGRLVYAVCTLTRAETVEVAEWATSELEGFEATARPGAPWRARGPGALLLPHAAGTDGMFVLGLRRGL
jgi:16S rRNA (cytosine967-C5)-methyltransferase